LSRTVRALEQELGVTLFERSGGRIRLTDAGAALAERARALLADAQRLRAHAQAYGDGEAGRLRIGYHEVAMRYPAVPRSFQAMRRDHPKVGLDILPMISPDQIAALRRRDIDAGFVYNYPQDQEFDGVDIDETGWLIAIPESNPVAQRASLRLADMADEDFVFIPEGIYARTREAVLAACARGGLNPRIVQEAFDEKTLLGLVSVGVGLSIVCEPALQQHGVVFRRAEDLTERLRLSLIWRRGDGNRTLMRFIEIVRSNRPTRPEASNS
jgi:DNA-binding transcriptional LysR family regulator